MSGSQNPKNVSQNVTVEQDFTALRRGNTAISYQTSPCHDTNSYNVHLTDTLTLQNEVTQNKPVYRYLLPLHFPPAHFFIFPAVFILMLVNITFVCDQCREVS
jgi:hypothetical protein